MTNSNKQWNLNEHMTPYWEEHERRRIRNGEPAISREEVESKIFDRMLRDDAECERKQKERMYEFLAMILITVVLTVFGCYIFNLIIGA